MILSDDQKKDKIHKIFEANKRVIFIAVDDDTIGLLHLLLLLQIL